MDLNNLKFVRFLKGGVWYKNSYTQSNGEKPIYVWSRYNKFTAGKENWYNKEALYLRKIFIVTSYLYLGIILYIACRYS